MRALSKASAALATFFFAFHMALFDALWKPMYVFDLLCATFCLAAMLLWTGGRWVLSFACFWLAYKSKELAVMLDTFHPLYVTTEAEPYDDKSYPYSWQEPGKFTGEGATG